MRQDREKAWNLRRQGFSYKQISKELGIATSTLSGWFKNEPWSQEIKTRLSSEISLSNARALRMMAMANKERWKIKYTEYRATAVKEFQRLKNDPLFLSGIMLYWGEGEKQQKSSLVKLSNSEPEMIKIFYLFLTRVLKISDNKIHAGLILYPDLIDSIQKNFWSKATGLSTDQFKKSIYIKGCRPTKRLSYGVCIISVQSRALKERILKWLELSQEFLLSHATNLEKLEIIG